MKNLAKVSGGELVQRFSEAAVANGSAMDRGDPRAGNRAVKTMGAIYRELRTRGPEDQSMLLVLLDHPDPYVRLWAAADCLEFAPERGEAVLEELARSVPGTLGFSAEMTLEVWRNGEMNFP